MVEAPSPLKVCAISGADARVGAPDVHDSGSACWSPEAQVTLTVRAAGSHVVYALQNTRRFKVISIDNHHNSYPKSLLRVSQLSKSELPEGASAQDVETTEIDAHKCNLAQPEQIRQVFQKYGKGGIWGVIHIAAYKAVGESTEIPLTYYANNVGATISLLQVMAEFDCTRIVYSSSATVYGIPPIIPIPETTRLQAESPYGKTKVMAETIIQDLCEAEPGRWRAISLRYFNPAGAHPSGVIGEDPRGRPGNLLPLLAHMAVGRVKEDKLMVFGNDYPTPDGTCVRDYLHVLDLASGHLLALDALAPGSTVFDNCPTPARVKAFNLGKGKGMSVYQIVEAMRKATGFDYKTEVIGRRAGDVPDLTADPALAEKELGFKADKDLDAMCRDLWNWQSKNPQGSPSYTEIDTVTTLRCCWAHYLGAYSCAIRQEFWRTRAIQSGAMG
ncbi:UDP-glucose-4-epimerase [Salix suchowensis]|nr:UDP-glucose-4-epimerase [Salix suchowensis]